MPGYKKGELKQKYHIYKRCLKAECDRCGDCIHTCNNDPSGLIAPDRQACYFVLRIDKDPNARLALRAYAKAVRPRNPQLADDLLKWLETTPINKEKDDADGTGTSNGDQNHSGR